MSEIISTETDDSEFSEEEPLTSQDDSLEQEIMINSRAKHKHSTKKHRGKPLAWCCLALLLTLTVFCCCLPFMFCFGTGVFASIASSNEQTRQETKEFDISSEGPVNLEVSNYIGETHIRGGSTNDKIEVEILYYATGLLKKRVEEQLDELEVEMRVDRENNRYIIKAKEIREKGFMFDDVSIDLLITVPTRLNITAINEVGSLSVRRVEIIDELYLENNVGAIEFDGQIGPNGTHEIVNNVGRINVNVTKDSSFRLEAVTEIGAVNLYLDLNDKDSERQDIGEDISGIYGDNENPDATLRITANVGAIDIRD